MRKITKLILFILISFLIPLASFYLQKKIPNSNVNLVLYGIQAASPSIAAIVVLIFSKEVRSHFNRIFQRGHILAAIVFPFLVASITMLISKSVYCFIFGKVFTIEKITMTKWLILLWALIAEELGWRGYLEPLLRELKMKTCANLPDFIYTQERMTSYGAKIGLICVFSAAVLAVLVWIFREKVQMN